MIRWEQWKLTCWNSLLTLNHYNLSGTLPLIFLFPLEVPKIRIPTLFFSNKIIFSSANKSDPPNLFTIIIYLTNIYYQILTFLINVNLKRHLPITITTAKPARSSSRNSRPYFIACHIYKTTYYNLLDGKNYMALI